MLAGWNYFELKLDQNARLGLNQNPRPPRPCRSVLSCALAKVFAEKASTATVGKERGRWQQTEPTHEKYLPQAAGGNSSAWSMFPTPVKTPSK